MRSAARSSRSWPARSSPRRARVGETWSELPAADGRRQGQGELDAGGEHQARDRARHGKGADAEQFEEITYEGIGPANVAVIIAAMTDNRNRTASEIRSIFTRHGGTLSTVAWQFVQRGVIAIPLDGRDPDEITLAAIDAGASDVSAPDAGSIIVTTEPADLEAVRRQLADAGYEAESAELSMEPTTTSRDQRREDREAVLQFVERLEDLDDVQEVYANFDIPGELMEQLEAQIA